jgi:hypothetical protein
MKRSGESKKKEYAEMMVTRKALVAYLREAEGIVAGTYKGHVTPPNQATVL